MARVETERLFSSLFSQTFHTPSFGDEEFDIPVMHHQQPPPQHHQLDQYHHQMHSHQMMSDQQAAAAAYGQHWHHQQSSAESHMMANQTYQLHSPNHSNYHHMSSPNQQMLLMQPPSSHPPPPAPAQHQQQSHQPQMSPQLNAGGNNYIGQSPPQTVRSNENGSTSDDSDDNALNDPNVSSPSSFFPSTVPGREGEKKSVEQGKVAVQTECCMEIPLFKLLQQHFGVFARHTSPSMSPLPWHRQPALEPKRAQPNPKDKYLRRRRNFQFHGLIRQADCKYLQCSAGVGQVQRTITSRKRLISAN
jgi:hypothetical protein